MQKMFLVIFIAALSVPHFCFNGGPIDVRQERAEIERQRAEEVRKAEEQKKYQDRLQRDFEDSLAHIKNPEQSSLATKKILQTKATLQEMTPDRAANSIMKIVEQVKNLARVQQLNSQDAALIAKLIEEVFTVKNPRDQQEILELFTGLNALREGLAREPVIIKSVIAQSETLLSGTFEHAHTYDGATLKALLLNLVEIPAYSQLGGMVPRDIFLGLVAQASPKVLDDTFKNNQQLSDYFFKSIAEVQKSITEIQQGRSLSEYDNRQITFAMTALEKFRSFYTDQQKINKTIQNFVATLLALPKEVIKRVLNSLRQSDQEGSAYVGNLLVQSFYTILEGMLGLKKVDAVLFNISLNYLLERKGLSLTQLIRLKTKMNAANVLQLMEGQSLKNMNDQIETLLQQAATEDIKSLQQLISETSDQNLLKQVIASKNNKLADLKSFARDQLLEKVKTANALEVFNLIVTDATSTQLRKWIDKVGTAAAIKAYDSAVKNNRGEVFINELFHAIIDHPQDLHLLESLFEAHPALLDRLIEEVRPQDQTAAQNIFNVIFPRASEVQLRTWMKRAGPDLMLKMYEVAYKQGKGEQFFRNLVQVIIEENWDPKKIEPLLKKSEFFKIFTASIAESNNVAFLQKIIPMLPQGSERQTAAINRLISLTTRDNAVANFSIIIEQDPSVEQISALVLKSRSADIGTLYAKAKAKNQAENFISALVRISIENPKIDVKNFFALFRESSEALVADLESLNANDLARAHNLLTKLAQSEAMPASVKAVARARLIESATPETVAEILSLSIADVSDQELEELAKKSTVDNVQAMYKIAQANSRVYDFISALAKTVENNNLDLGVYAKFFEANSLAKEELKSYLANKASLSFLKTLITSADQTYAPAKNAAIDALVSRTNETNVVENFRIVIPTATPQQVRSLLDKAGTLNGATIERLYAATPDNKQEVLTTVLAAKAQTEKWPINKFMLINNMNDRILVLSRVRKGIPAFESIESHLAFIDAIDTWMQTNDLPEEFRKTITKKQLEMMNEIATRFRDLNEKQLQRLESLTSAIEKQIKEIKADGFIIDQSLELLARVQTAIMRQQKLIGMFGWWHSLLELFVEFNLNEAAQNKEKELLQDFKTKLGAVKSGENKQFIAIIDQELERLKEFETQRLQAAKKSQDRKRAA